MQLLFNDQRRMMLSRSLSSNIGCLIVMTSVLFMGKSEGQSDCFSYIKDLSVHDAFLCGRRPFAQKVMDDDIVTAGRFVEAMQHVPQEHNETYSCGYTRFWIDFLYRGSALQFEELRGSYPTLGYGPGAGYVDLLDPLQSQTNLMSLFYSYSDLTEYMVLFKFQIAGIADHVWMVVQTPGPAYRVFQSYNNAYSLYAWLSSDLTGLYSFDPPGHIRYWNDVYDILNEQFGLFIADGVLDLPPEVPFESVLEEFGNFILNYNQTSIEANLYKSWNFFGKGQIVPGGSFLSHYVKPLHELMSSMKKLADDPNTNQALWTRKLHDQWIYHFGSPNPLQYPGLPINFLPALIGLKGLELQVRVDLVPLLDNDCRRNFMQLWNSIPSRSSHQSKKSGTIFSIGLFLVLFVIRYH